MPHIMECPCGLRHICKPFPMEFYLFYLWKNDSWEQTFDNSILSMMRYIHNPGGFYKCSKISQFNTCVCVFIYASTKYLRKFLYHNILETCPIEIKLKVKDNNR